MALLAGDEVAQAIIEHPGIFAQHLARHGAKTAVNTLINQALDSAHLGLESGLSRLKVRGTKRKRKQAKTQKMGRATKRRRKRGAYKSKARTGVVLKQHAATARRVRHKKVTRKRRGKSLKKRVSKLEREAGTHTSEKTTERVTTYKYNNTGTSNTSLFREYEAFDTPRIKTLLNTLLFFDETNAGSSGAYIERDFNLALGGALMQSSMKFGVECYSQITIRNNTGISATLQVYCCAPKGSTNAGPQAAMSELDNRFESYPAGTKTLTDYDSTFFTMTPSRSSQFQDDWRMLKKYKVELLPGDTFKAVHSAKTMFKPSDLSDGAGDDVDQDYRRKHNAFIWMINSYGPLVHDATTGQESQVAIGGSELDLMVRNIYKVKYNAGGPGVKYFDFEDETTNVTYDNQIAGAITNPTVENQNGTN